jgi:hypothetical protein
MAKRRLKSRSWRQPVTADEETGKVDKSTLSPGPGRRSRRNRSKYVPAKEDRKHREAQEEAVE